MSDQTLREALERELATLPVMRYDSNEYPTQALAKARLLDLLAMHPAESAPRPVIDREAVYSLLRATRVTVNDEWRPTETSAGQITDAVMELARPMPTREQVAEEILRVLQRKCVGGARSSAVAAQYRHEIAMETSAVVLALLNGSES